VPGFQRLSNAAVAFVNYLSIVKDDGMIKGPGMFCYIGAFSTLFSISDMIALMIALNNAKMGHFQCLTALQ